MARIDELEYVDVPGGTRDLGWRFDEHLGPEARDALDSFMPRAEFMQRHSPARSVRLQAFRVARTSLDAEALLADVDDAELDALDGLDDLCQLLDRVLATEGLRLPSEDELEAACGGALFSWGYEIPDGTPWAGDTAFRLHKERNELGLLLNDNPYKVEIARSALKLGDGGESICGGYPWPIAWLTLAPSHRLMGPAVDDLLFEFLESALVRPIQKQF